MQTVIEITFNDENGQYGFKIPKGGNVAEVAFAISALARVLAREKLMDSPDTFINLINKYLHDTQFDEVKEVKEDATSEVYEGVQK